ncbi:hypothetical protein BDY19DRAFT_9604 [Irpex rosettiformis]|uniref:Uncharacterized protein n=1 Tax=Irpex rosettiformis TaxID=378272 RepID=A0ACB8UKH5_9APHY|nr:hypothetical protein BDY19DRAFT_9604 [Irpex rosettiformis]
MDSTIEVAVLRTTSHQPTIPRCRRTQRLPYTVPPCSPYHPREKTAILVTPDTYPKVELALSNPSQWNDAWENLYASSPVLVHPNHILSMTRTMRLNHKAHEGSLDNHQDKYRDTVNYKSTCEIQLRLGVKIVNTFTIDDFELCWGALMSVSQRREHVLKALVNAGAQAKNLNLARAYCADILRVDYLSTDGEVVLDLLRELVPQDISVTPAEPYWVCRSKEWEEVREKFVGGVQVVEEEDRGDLIEVLVLRTKLIYFVLEGIVDSFLGHSLPRVTVHKERDRRAKEVKLDDHRRLADEYKKLYGEAGQEKLRKDLAAMEERKSRREVHCTNCQRTQREGERFMRCKKCWDGIQRNVMYCGKTCQVTDWKLRHKKICGKPLSSIDSMFAAACPQQGCLPPPQANQFPAPTNGFRRTPQLVMHIRLLDTAPQYDYILRVSAVDFVEIVIPNERIQAIFRAARYKAFVDGDREACVEMCHFLVWFARAKLDDVNKGWNLRYTVKLMKREFEFPELMARMKECQDAQWKDELRRP